MGVFLKSLFGWGSSRSSLSTICASDISLLLRLRDGDLDGLVNFASIC
jgi:hypothetical protein